MYSRISLNSSETTLEQEYNQFTILVCLGMQLHPMSKSQQGQKHGIHKAISLLKFITPSLKDNATFNACNWWAITCTLRHSQGTVVPTCFWLMKHAFDGSFTLPDTDTETVTETNYMCGQNQWKFASVLVYVHLNHFWAL